MYRWIVLSFFAACSADQPTGDCTSSSNCDGGICIDGRCVARPDGGTPDATTPLDASPIDASRPDAPTRDASGCTPAPETLCNGIDDDCNGIIDDVDVGGDGICDCLRIGVLGTSGSLASSNFQAWLESRGTSVARFSLDATLLTAEQLAAYDVLVLDRLVRDYSEGEAALLEDFVEAGGGVMVMTGYDGSGADFARPNTLLAPFGAQYVGGLQSGPVTEWETHPVSDGVSSVTFAGGYLITDSTGTSTVVARLAGGVAGLAIERGEGRLFVWGDEWIEFDSEWSTMPMITQLWTNLFAWLGPRDSCVLLI